MVEYTRSQQTVKHMDFKIWFETEKQLHKYFYYLISNICREFTEHEVEADMKQGAQLRSTNKETEFHSHEQTVLSMFPKNQVYVL